MALTEAVHGPVQDREEVVRVARTHEDCVKSSQIAKDVGIS